MFDLEKAIANWRRDLFLAGIQQPEVLEELENHLRDELARLQDGGLPQAEQFQNACSLIGKPRAIKQEFAKVKRGRFQSGWGRPAALNFLGVWFGLMGLSGLTYLPALWEMGFSTTLFRVAICVAFCAVQMVIGLGLFQRLHFWRYGALAWIAVFLIGSLASGHPFGGMVSHVVFHRIHAGGDLLSKIETLSHWQLTLFTRSADFEHVIDFLSPAILIWGAWLLTQRQVREAFHSARRANIA